MVFIGIVCTAGLAVGSISVVVVVLVVGLGFEVICTRVVAAVVGVF